VVCKICLKVVKGSVDYEERENKGKGWGGGGGGR